jgi:hypothetical protein
MFANAQILARKNPDTFHAPSEEDLSNIVVGSFVKVCYELPPPETGERFWAIVLEVCGGTITAKVDNLLLSAPFRVGEIIIFEKKHVYDVMIA